MPWPRKKVDKKEVAGWVWREMGMRHVYCGVVEEVLSESCVSVCWAW